MNIIETSIAGLVIIEPRIFEDSRCVDRLIPHDKAILSDKDIHHPLLNDFDSPFTL